MAVVIFDAKKQRLIANCSGRYPSEELAMSLRLRRLFYVGKFAAIGVTGPSVNGFFNKNAMRAITLATAAFEKTGVFEIPMSGMNKVTMFGPKSDTSFIVMTKKGLYDVAEEGVKVLDDSETQAYGGMASVFNVVNTKIKDIEKALKFMSTTTTFITDMNLIIERKDLGDVFDLDVKDEFGSTMRLDNR